MSAFKPRAMKKTMGGEISSYFYIRSALNGLVLEVKGGRAGPGVPVITGAERPQDNDHQLFYEDTQTGTIRTKLNQLCLDIQGDKVIVNTYFAGNQSQQWMFAGQFIQNPSNQVLDIVGNNSSPGARICAYHRNGQANQQWARQDITTGYFYIGSDLNDLVMDVRGGTPGTPVITWSYRSAPGGGQLFYEDQASGTLRSKVNQLCLDIQGDKLVVNSFYPGNQSQQWMFAGQFIQNRSNFNQVLNVAGNNAKPGAIIGSNNRNGQANQRWNRHYVGGCVPGQPTGATSPPQSTFPTAAAHPTPFTFPSQAAYPSPVTFPSQVAYPSPVTYPGLGGGQRYFYLRSQLNGLVLDAEGGGRTAGTRLIMWNQKHGSAANNQLFYEDHQSGCIKCKDNSLCIEAQGDRVVLNDYQPGNLSQQWLVYGDQVIMRTHTSHVLDVADRDGRPGARVCSWVSNGGANQRWIVQYV